MYPPCLAALPVLALILAACAASPPPEGEEGRRGPSAERPARGLRGELRGSDGPGGVRDDLQAQLSEVEQRLSLTPFQQVRGERYREATGALMADRLLPGPGTAPALYSGLASQHGRRRD